MCVGLSTTEVKIYHFPHTNFQVKMLVGGEESKNEKIKQRKNERKKHADKKRDELKMLVEQDVSKAVDFARADVCRCSDSSHRFGAPIRCFDSVLCQSVGSFE